MNQLNVNQETDQSVAKEEFQQWLDDPIAQEEYQDWLLAGREIEDKKVALFDWVFGARKTDTQWDQLHDWFSVQGGQSWDLIANLEVLEEIKKMKPSF